METGFISEDERKSKPPQHTEEYLRTVYACGQRRDHLVKIHRSKWPPQAQPGLNDRPYIAAKCERCGAVCIVYDPVPSDMTVMLYGVKGEEAGRVIEEGAVVDEEAMPGAGQVVDESELPRKGRR